jgi:hypothetical protein
VFLIVSEILKSNCSEVQVMVEVPMRAQTVKILVFFSLYPSNGRLMPMVPEGGHHHGSLAPKTFIIRKAEYIR